MPQMMPLYWLNLMMFFILVFFLFNNQNYYNLMYNFKLQKKTNLTLNFNWKW
uniref:ATP synthase F0 subunit 8 n=1 Tax=Ophraella communa TaxID=38162 RepID=UPI000EF29B6C|nr:ATP synthase F0 subunit 8 [Ophraella communa]AST14955.1 ATP synthase F0 subunit 8 [Ophraella communa]